MASVAPGKLPAMQEGLYESLVTEELAAALEQLDGLSTALGDIDPADQPHVLARHVASQVERRLAEIRDPLKLLELVNGVLAALQPTQTLQPPARNLLSIAADGRGGRAHIPTARPATPLSEAALLTNAHGEPGLGAEVKAELASCDEVDLLLRLRQVAWPPAAGIRTARPTRAQGAAAGHHHDLHGCHRACGA
jgi:hypothetical protein